MCWQTYAVDFTEDAQQVAAGGAYPAVNVFDLRAGLSKCAALCVHGRCACVCVRVRACVCARN
jgi:hypothetical protein